MTMPRTSPIAQPVRQCRVAEMALRVRALPSLTVWLLWPMSASTVLPPGGIPTRSAAGGYGRRMTTSAVAQTIDLVALQRRTLRVLLGAQVLAGAGLAAGVTVGA